MKRPRPFLRRRRRGVLAPRTPTAADLLALLRADWPRLEARPGFADRVLLAVRHTAPARDRPRRLRAGVLVGAAGAFLLAFAAGLIEAGRGGVRSAADGTRSHCPHTLPAAAPRGVAPPGGLEVFATLEALPGPDPDAPHPLDDRFAFPDDRLAVPDARFAVPWVHRTATDPAPPAGRDRP
jgi:hypothetical protein